MLAKKTARLHGGYITSVLHKYTKYFGSSINICTNVIYAKIIVFFMIVCVNFSAVPSHNLNDNKKVMFFTDNLLCVNKEDALYPQKCLQLGGLSLCPSFIPLSNE